MWGGETLRAAQETLAVAAPGWLAGWLAAAGRRTGVVRTLWQAHRLLPLPQGSRRPAAVGAGRGRGRIRTASGRLRTRRTGLAAGNRGSAGPAGLLGPAVPPRREGAWREGKDLPPVHHRLCSPYDTDARYGIKRGSGWTDYKAHLTETCEPHAPHVITQVAATDAVVADTEMTEPGHRALAERELLPDVHVVDAGYTTAALFLSATERGMELLGPAPHDSSRQSREDQGFSRADFAINWDNESAICPGGHRSFEWWEQKHHRNDTPVLKVFFETSCTKPPSGRRGRGITFLPRERHEALRSGPPGPGDRQLEEPLRDPGRGRRHDLPGCPCHRPAPHPLPRSTHDPLRPRLRRHRDQPHPHQTDG